MTDDPKKPAEGDPFGASEDELSKELDQWDAAFDSLTQTGESRFDGLIKQDEDSTQPPKSSGPASLPGLPEEPSTDDGLKALFGEDKVEDDFPELDDLGASASGLGTLLGAPPPLMPAPLEGEAEEQSRPGVVNAAAGESDRLQDSLHKEEHNDFDEDDDHLYTSAPKPVLAPAPTDEELFGGLPDKVPDAALKSGGDGKNRAVTAKSDPQEGVDSTRIADPDQALLDALVGDSPGDPDPVDSTRIAGPDVMLLAESAVKDEPAKPRKPAIVRRDDLERMRKEREEAEQASASDGGAGDFGDDGFGGSTRIADAALIENIVDASESEAAAAADAAAEAFFADEPPEVTLELDEDFYDDIQIGDSGEEEADPEPEVEAPKRKVRTAHTVRRASAPDISDVEAGGIVLHIDAEPSDAHGMINAERPEPVSGEVGASEPSAAALAEAQREMASRPAVEVADDLVLGEVPLPTRDDDEGEDDAFGEKATVISQPPPPPEVLAASAAPPPGEPRERARTAPPPPPIPGTMPRREDDADATAVVHVDSLRPPVVELDDESTGVLDLGPLGADLLGADLAAAEEAPPPPKGTLRAAREIQELDLDGLESTQGAKPAASDVVLPDELELGHSVPRDRDAPGDTPPVAKTLMGMQAPNVIPTGAAEPVAAEVDASAADAVAVITDVPAPDSPVAAPVAPMEADVSADVFGDLLGEGEGDAFDEQATVQFNPEDAPPIPTGGAVPPAPPAQPSPIPTSTQEGGTLVGMAPSSIPPAAIAEPFSGAELDAVGVDEALDSLVADIGAKPDAPSAEAPEPVAAAVEEPEPVAAEEPEPEPESELAEVDVEPELPPSKFATTEPSLDLDALSLPEQVEAVVEDQSEELAQKLLLYEREIELLDDPGPLARLSLYAGRLAEGLGDLDRARTFYEEALGADPRLIPAMRALRRVEQASGRWVEAVSYLDAELAETQSDEGATPEQRALIAYRSDLLMASGEQDLARVAVGEVLDERADDVPALLANLELAFADGRDDEFEETLDRLSDVLANSAFGSVIDALRGSLAEGRNDRDAAMTAYRKAIQGEGAGRPAFSGLARTLLRAEKYQEAATVVHHIASATGLGEVDPGYAAALQWRRWSIARAAKAPDVAADALIQSVALVNDDPGVLFTLADAYSGAEEAATALRVLLRAADVAPSVVDKAQANWRAAKLLSADIGSPADAADAMRRVVMLDPSDVAAAAELEVMLGAAGEVQALIEIDRHAAQSDPKGTVYERLRAADRLVEAGQFEEAVTELSTAVAAGASSPVLSGTLIDLYRRVGRAKELAEFSAAASEAEWVDVAEGYRRAARAAEQYANELIAASAAPEGGEAPTDEQRASAITTAIAAWEKVLDLGDDDGSLAEAHMASLRLVDHLGDPARAEETLAVSQAAELGADGYTHRGVGLAMRRVALRLSSAPADGEGADDILREVRAQQPGEPRSALLLLIRAVSGERWDDAAALLEDRAQAVGTAEASALRFRAAGFLLDCCEDPARAVELLAPLTEQNPEFGAAHEMLETAHRRMDDPSALAADLDRATHSAADNEGAERPESFATIVREAELFEYRVGDPAKALDCYTKALAMRPNDPLARDGMRRTAIASSEAAPLANLALADLKRAEDNDDNIAKAEAYELLGRIDDEVRGDPAAALLAWESASTADPSRHQLTRVLERTYARDARWPDLYKLYQRMSATLAGTNNTETDASEFGTDMLWLVTEQARLAGKLERSGEMLTHYRSAYARDPKHRRALFAIEADTRTQGASAALANLQHAVADYFVGDDRSQAAFFTRAGETYTMLEQWEPAIGCFRTATDLVAGYLPALNGWRFAALKAELWLDVAEVARREAEVAVSDAQRVRLSHMAGVALMDRALDGERAIPAFSHVLSLSPSHDDAFVRLRLLLDENGHHEDLATLLRQRLEVETDRGGKLELLHALADLHRNFLSDRESAKSDLRKALELNPNDLIAVATLSDIAWEQGEWAEAAEALIARARLEKSPNVLKNIFYRLGTIYSERLPNPRWALASFQKVLGFDANDMGALAQLANLAMKTEDWKLALGACERLLKLSETASAKVLHLHRAAQIYLQGFNDRPRAEKMLRVALDLDPTNGSALDALAGFYKSTGDTRSMRVHVDRVAAAMRTRLKENLLDGTAYNVLGRALEVREEAGVAGSMAAAQCAGEMAKLLDVADDHSSRLAALATRARPRVLGLGKANVDELLFPDYVPNGLRQIWRELGDRLGKHVGVDVRKYGVGRGDRLAKTGDPVSQIVFEVAKDLGINDVEIYVSKRQPHIAVAEPTNPVSLVMGQGLVEADNPATVRFMAGRALKLASASLAVPARLSSKEFSVLLVALLRQFQPDLAVANVSADAIAAEQQRLRRLIPSKALQNLSPYATAVAGFGFDPVKIWTGIAQAGNRAGLLAAGSVSASLSVAMKIAGKEDLKAAIADPVLGDLIRFSVSDDHARLRAMFG